MSPGPVEQVLSGWGRTAPSRASILVPRDQDELLAAVASAGGAASGSAGRAIPRGLGRSYGDAAQSAGGTVIETSGLSRIGPIGPTGLVEVEAGVSLHLLSQRSLAQGFFVGVSPGTRQVSIGGAIAADIHGKNHHRDGSFCNHVTTLTLVTPSGVAEVGPGTAQDPELFWATAGGMGLTGVVARATLQLTAVETSWMVVDTERFTELDGVMAAMTEGDHRYRYSVAWVDCTPRRGPAGRKGAAGRAVLTRGDHATAAQIEIGGRRRERHPFLAEPRLKVPFPGPRRLLNAATIAAFNEVSYRRAPRRRTGELQSLASFLHPLDGVADWNLLYGPAGFVQYQFAVDDAHGELVRQAIDVLGQARVPSFLAVLKRFGPGDPGPLSFPTAGWTLALDFPVGPPGLAGALDRLDKLVAEAGGRVYLAKDARLRPELLPAMYPRLEAMAAVRRRVDPEGLLSSDLSRRLGIDRLTYGLAYGG